MNKAPRCFEVPAAMNESESPAKQAWGSSVHAICKDCFSNPLFDRGGLCSPLLLQQAAQRVEQAGVCLTACTGNMHSP